ncbi:hypothetical protein Bhyg_00605 [Pseudolycoriella hygida]|uniref:Uncharacterized protein n=1 Tax=Pseudolycoriella hygida TaxID=35572 RepID=A0A9Q0S544_9DIPT|nr:hypothetical protein Bhyg_00605 [Pseudolycoriella hygida]
MWLRVLFLAFLSVVFVTITADYFEPLPNFFVLLLDPDPCPYSVDIGSNSQLFAALQQIANVTLTTVEDTLMKLSGQDLIISGTIVCVSSEEAKNAVERALNGALGSGSSVSAIVSSILGSLNLNIPIG